MNLIFWVDRKTLEKFEKFSHFCQRMFGITSFVLARIMLIIIVLVLLIKFWFAAVYYQNQFFAFVQIIMLGITYVFWTHCSTIEDEFWRSGNAVPESATPSLAPVQMFVRIYFLANVAFRSVFFEAIIARVKSIEHMFYLADFIFPTAVLCFLYFILVRPLPPGEIRLLKPTHQAIDA